MKNGPVWSRFILANGIKVIYRQDKTFPLAAGTLLFRAGCRDETLSQAGLCSMTVDLLMQGTRKRTAKELAHVVESVGASVGTQAHQDYAELGFVAPSAKMQHTLSVTAEILHEPAFPREEIAKEKSHVQASLASRHDAIFNVAYDHVNHIMFGQHPYGRPLEGFATTVRRFGLSDFKHWHREKVRPDQATLAMLAPYSQKEALKILQKTLGQWPLAKLNAAEIQPLPTLLPLKKSETQEYRSSFEQAYLMVAWQAPGSAHKDQHVLKVLNALLGGGMSSRLFVTLREKLGLAYEVSSFYPSRLDGSQWVIYLGLPKEKLAIASKKLNEMLVHLADVGPTEGEMNQAKAMIRGAFLMDRQSRRRQAWYMAFWELLGRGPRYGEEFVEAIDGITRAEILRVLRGILAQPRVTVTVIPK